MKFNALFSKYLLAGYLVLAIMLWPGGAAAADGDLTLSPEQAQALALLNGDRAENGLEPLVYHDALTKLAEDYARDMRARQFFAHDNPEGLTPFDRMDARGIQYRYAGENLALNDSVGKAQAAFMNSPTHRANVLNPNFKEVGIGVIAAPNGSVYVVQEFIGN